MKRNQVRIIESVAGEASALLFAMANPKRLVILCRLLEGERNVNDLAALVGMTQTALSQQLAKLRAMRLVETRREKQQIFYRLGSEEIARLLRTLYEIYCGPRTRSRGR